MASSLPDRWVEACRAGLLEPGDALAVRRAAATDPDVAARLVASHAPQAAPLHPHGAAAGADAAAWLDDAPGIVHVDVPPMSDPARWRPVVLHADGGVVRVLHPTRADRFVPLTAVPAARGHHRLSIAATADARLEVLLVPDDVAFEDPEDAAPWQCAREAARAGRWPGWVVERTGP